MVDLPDLPVSDVLPELTDALDTSGSAVLTAPPGAGKTTIVPLALLAQDWAQTGRIILIEPRRIAARSAARRMASLIGEEPGKTVGYAMRMENRSGPETRILVVTEGVFTRMVLDDPELTGISAVLFDEFHERSLDGDFGLALVLDIASALRPDLKLLVMSATLDQQAVATLIGGAPIIESTGRSFPVETVYQPRPAGQAVEDAVAAAVRQTLSRDQGSCLAFLPGQYEIARVFSRLSGNLPADVDVIALHGGLDGKAQDAAIRPASRGRRKVVLATSIAETSITIDGVNTVIDAGLARVPRFEPATGLTRLETVRVSKASADQRAGRAGRTAPGTAIRLWNEAQTASLPDIAPPEILEADLSGLLLDCAEFGVTDPAGLCLLNPPPPAALAAARQQLADLGALDRSGGITAAGKAIRKLPLPVRLANMVTNAARQSGTKKAAELAVLLTERGLGGTEVDIDRRLDRFREDRGNRAKKAAKLAARLAKTADGRQADSLVSSAVLLLDACPDRVAGARGRPGHFVLANGRGAVLDEANPLAREPFLVVADMQGRAQNARITAAAAISLGEIETHLEHRLETQTTAYFDRQSRSVRQRQTVRLDAVTLREKTLRPPTGDLADEAILVAIGEHGLDLLAWDKSALQLRHRLQWLHDRLGAPWPSMDDVSLIDRLETWLQPYLAGEPHLSKLAPQALRHGLLSLLPHDLAGRADDYAPRRFTAPSGNSFAIDYSGDAPTVAIRVQELFGLDVHPAVAGGAVPLKIELLSPAGRPIQATADLPGFWRGSWSEVRKEMKGRYPKHVWPDKPQSAAPTTRTKTRSK